MNTATTPAIRWTDRAYAVPLTLPAPGFTGAQETARRLFDLIEVCDHAVAEAAYVEETASASGILGRVRAIRMECTADGRTVSIRCAADTPYPDAWTVTVGGRRQDHGMATVTALPERLTALALTVHRALRHPAPDSRA